MRAYIELLRSTYFEGYFYCTCGSERLKTSVVFTMKNWLFAWQLSFEYRTNLGAPSTIIEFLIAYLELVVRTLPGSFNNNMKSCFDI